MAAPRLSRVFCRLCPGGREWHARDPVASWRDHWTQVHARRSIFEGTR